MNFFQILLALCSSAVQFQATYFLVRFRKSRNILRHSYNSAFTFQTNISLLKHFEHSAKIDVILFLISSIYNDVILYIYTSWQVNKDFFHGILKYFSCCADTIKKTLISSKPNVGRKSGDVTISGDNSNWWCPNERSNLLNIVALLRSAIKPSVNCGH